jgi:hypothetical protein
VVVAVGDVGGGLEDDGVLTADGLLLGACVGVAVAVGVGVGRCEDWVAVGVGTVDPDDAGLGVAEGVGDVDGFE